LKFIQYRSAVEESPFLKALLKIVYLEGPIRLEEALSPLEREPNVTRLTPKGLKWIFRSHQLAGYTAQNYLVEARGGGID
jgi:hypothetical protein